MTFNSFNLLIGTTIFSIFMLHSTFLSFAATQIMLICKVKIEERNYKTTL